MLSFERSIDDVTTFTANNCGWCGASHKKFWGTGTKGVGTAKFDHLMSARQFTVPAQGKQNALSSDPRLERRARVSSDVSIKTEKKLVIGVAGIIIVIRNSRTFARARRL